MLSYLNDIDTQIFLTLNGVCSPFWDSFMSEFSGKWIWIPFYASILFVISRKFNYKQTLGILVCAALCIALSDQTCATLIRPFAERMRPANLANPISPYVHIVDGYRGGCMDFRPATPPTRSPSPCSSPYCSPTAS